jgi:P-type Mg2+ transporter
LNSIEAKCSLYLADFANMTVVDALEKFNSSLNGLDDEQIASSTNAPNALSATKPRPWWILLWACIPNPFNILLAVLAIISAVTQQMATFVILIIMVSLSIGLRFWQEQKNSIALSILIQRVEDKVRVIRNGSEIEVSKTELIPGDIVRLSGGDVIPADVILINTSGLYVSQSSLTGENMPVLKQLTGEPVLSTSILEAPNLCFSGSTVVSGSATVLVIATGDGTTLYHQSDCRNLHWLPFEKYFSNTR